jgi:hypothetical protein
MVVVVALVVTVMPALSAGASAKGSADLQWAQQVLKERGFDAGRPNGEMTAKTRGALAAFQRSVGLPASGDLDAATVDRLIAGRPAGATVGVLGGAPHGQGGGAGVGTGPGSGSAVSHATPHAAPSGRVDAVGDGGGTPMLGTGGPVPKAAPSGAVSTVASPLLPGEAAANGAAHGAADAGADGAAGGDPLQIVVPAWVRNAVIGVIVAILGGFGVLWWLGGRRPGRRPLSQSRVAGRHEPSFESGGGGGHDLRARRLG